MNKRRLAAMLLIIAGVIIGDFAMLFPPAEQLEARNTTTMTIIIGQRPVPTHAQPKPDFVTKTGGGGGGGTLHVH